MQNDGLKQFLFAVLFTAALYLAGAVDYAEMERAHVAQQAERLTCNQQAGGSTPPVGLPTEWAISPIVDPLLIAAVIHVESRGNPLAQSACYAMGLMQIRPSTCVLYGGEPGRLFDPAYNVELGTRILAELISAHGLEAALSVWNTGHPDHPRGAVYAARVMDEMKRRTQ